MKYRIIYKCYLSQDNKFPRLDIQWGNLESNSLNCGIDIPIDNYAYEWHRAVYYQDRRKLEDYDDLERLLIFKDIMDREYNSLDEYINKIVKNIIILYEAEQEEQSKCYELAEYFETPSWYETNIEI